MPNGSTENPLKRSTTGLSSTSNTSQSKPTTQTSIQKDVELTKVVIPDDQNDWLALFNQVIENNEP